MTSFFNWFGKLYRASRPLRAFYQVISIISIAFTLGSAIYYGFFDHRSWVNQRIAESYTAVEKQQYEVVELLVKVIPSRSNNDRTPTEEQVSDLRSALVKLSGTVTMVDTLGDDMVIASSDYRGTIADLTGALARYNPNDPSTQGDLHLAIDRWDVAADRYAKTVESRIGSFSQSLLPSA